MRSKRFIQVKNFYTLITRWNNDLIKWSSFNDIPNMKSQIKFIRLVIFKGAAYLYNAVNDKRVPAKDVLAYNNWKIANIDKKLAKLFFKLFPVFTNKQVKASFKKIFIKIINISVLLLKLLKKYNKTYIYFSAELAYLQTKLVSLKKLNKYTKYKKALIYFNKKKKIKYQDYITLCNFAEDLQQKIINMKSLILKTDTLINAEYNMHIYKLLALAQSVNLSLFCKLKTNAIDYSKDTEQQMTISYIDVESEQLYKIILDMASNVDLDEVEVDEIYEINEFEDYDERILKKKKKLCKFKKFLYATWVDSIWNNLSNISILRHLVKDIKELILLGFSYPSEIKRFESFIITLKKKKEKSEGTEYFSFWNDLFIEVESHLITLIEEKKLLEQTISIKLEKASKRLLDAFLFVAGKEQLYNTFYYYVYLENMPLFVRVLIIEDILEIKEDTTLGNFDGYFNNVLLVSSLLSTGEYVMQQN